MLADCGGLRGALRRVGWLGWLLRQAGKLGDAIEARENGLAVGWRQVGEGDHAGSSPSSGFRIGTTLAEVRRLADRRPTPPTPPTLLVWVMLLAGVPVHVVSQRLGHSSPVITMKIYAHVMPGNQKDAADLFGRILREAGA